MLVALIGTSCVVSKKKFSALQSDLANSQKEKEELQGKVYSCEKSNSELNTENLNLRSTLIGREAHIEDLKSQLTDCKQIRVFYKLLNISLTDLGDNDYH